ncbi:MAG: ketoacyl-ACP synthase III [Victivallaceae bacterium]|nr:ketoacyl-ACP synthase III [Victivallaceae bacterium]MDD4181108.1 ketoacyl-ACP synthase III [Victivallaceae bacterium]
MGIRIAGTGSYLPEKILTNSDLTQMVETSDEWITTRTGIAERHIAADDEAVSDMAYHASIRAIEAAGISSEEIDGIIFCTITPDHLFPSSACILQQRLNCPRAFCFDLQAACTGLIYALEVAHSMMLTNKKFKRVLVVSSEKLSYITDWSDRNTCVLFGDGAAALLLETTENGEDSIIAASLGADGNHWEKLQVPAGGSRMPLTPENINESSNYIHMDGQDVFKLAIGAMADSSNEALEIAKLTSADIDWLVPHQANLRILKMVANRLSIPHERVYVNVNRYGNTSSATIGICLDEMIREGLIKKGQNILLTAFGGGLTWGSIIIKY